MDKQEGGEAREYPKVKFIKMTAETASAYVAGNHIHSGELAGLIEAVYASLTSLGAPKAVPEQPEPPVSVRKSITHEYLISMEDGRHYKSLKRHLSARGLTPQEYKSKWGLPLDYPMVAPAYAALRSIHAKSIGLGRKKRETPEPRKRGRGTREVAEPA